MSSAGAEGPELSGRRLGGFLLNVNLVFAGTIIDYGLSFLAGVVLARALGSEGRGVVAVFQTSVGLAFAVLGLGIATAVVYFIGRRELAPRQALEAGMSVTLAAGCVCGLGVVFAGIALGGLTESDAPFWLAAVAVPGAIQYRVLEGVLRGQGRFGAMNLLAVCLPATTLGALLVIEATSSLTVTTAVQVWSLSFLAPVVVGYALVGRSSWPRALPGPARIRRIVVFGAQGQLGNLIQLLNYRLDSYLVLIFVGAGGVGLYAVGVSLSEGMWFVANSVAVVLLTDLSAGDQASAGRMTAVVCRNTLLVTAIAALAAAPLAPFIIPLVFGADFDGSVVPFLLLLPGTVALAGVKVLAAYIFSRGRPIINAYIAIAALIVTVSADLALIPWLGVAGAALGSSLAYGVSLALTLAVYRSLSGHPVLEPVTPRRSDAELYLQAFRSLAGRGAR